MGLTMSLLRTRGPSLVSHEFSSGWSAGEEDVQVEGTTAPSTRNDRSPGMMWIILTAVLHLAPSACMDGTVFSMA